MSGASKTDRAGTGDCVSGNLGIASPTVSYMALNKCLSSLGLILEVGGGAGPLTARDGLMDRGSPVGPDSSEVKSSH